MAENSGGAAKRRGPGRPFPPGVSGNPAGRPKAVAEIRELARVHTSAAVQTLVTIMREGRTDAARVAAAQALLDRGWGRATQVIETQEPQPIRIFPPGAAPDPDDEERVILADGTVVSREEAARRSPWHSPPRVDGAGAARSWRPAEDEDGKGRVRPPR